MVVESASLNFFANDELLRPPRGVCASLIPENNALISRLPANNALVSLKLFAFTPQIPKKSSASPQIFKHISEFSLKCIYLSVR